MAKSSQPDDTVAEMLEQWRVERPDLDLAGMEVVLRILVLSRHLESRLKLAVTPLGLAPWEFDVLSALRRVGAGHGLTPSELCESAHLTSGAMTHRIDGLEAKGLVRRRAEATDRRSVLVTLTPKGLRLTDRAIEARMRDACESVSSLERKAQSDLGELLSRLLASLESH